MDIATQVAQTIKEKKIKPLPKSYFVVRHVLVWSAVAGTVVLTGVACGVMVYLLSGHEWGIRVYTGESFSKDLARSLPYFWLVLSTILLGLAVANSRWLRRRYSVRPGVYFAFYGVTALLVGVVISQSGFGVAIEEAVAPHIPAYRSMVMRPQDDWYMPQLGFIAGHIMESRENGISFSDCRGGHWVIDASQAVWRCGVERTPGTHVKLIGTVVSDGMFKVEQIIPWNVSLAGVERCERNRALTP